ncbi:insulinase family protein [Geofilum rubicundum]|uniref:Protein hypA n=1 Tax=Geofilum rubicundum JCM 15548 TaxID=1236989 RepID=A0A0E9LXJ6_9BACT|nr:insulinase family protein [Geofilum rubicundum]GAO30307.1 protein hypA [Geofilum rubicundum JCM 15548]
MKHIALPLMTIVIMALLGACTKSASYQEGEVYHGFQLIENRFVEEVNANCLYFVHEKSGARLMKIAADDANKLFSVSFKTTPADDYGTPHIMEHSVLNGSKNFPVKSPFDQLLKGSLNTFLNAMTGSDFTTYPVASMNEKDYFNLMHVYMDAVFNPLLHSDPNILKQEGWHYELDSLDGDIVYKGVVYNEMKGAYSSPERELDYQIYKLLFPDNTYGVSSGGYPSAIPKLTQAYFKEFHNTYYHPSNSFVLLYGDADLDQELSFLDQNYFNAYETSDKVIEIPLQAPFDAKKTAVKPYSVPLESETEDQTFLSYNFVAGLNTDEELVMALDILSEALVNHESAPLRLAIQEAGIGKDIYAWVDNTMQNVFQVTVQNANLEDQEQFDDLFFNTLKHVVDSGFDTETVEGIVNRMEFRLREGNTPQKGLMYLFALKNSLLFDENPFAGLEFEKPLAAVKEGIKNGLLESIVQKHLIDNPHALLMVLEPQPGLENELAEKTTQELAEYKSSLNQEELEQLIADTKALKEAQQKEDSPEALATIPMLALSDVSEDVQWYETVEKSVSEVPVLHYNDFTNNIVYANLFFDMHALPKELIPYGRLMTELIGKLNTENYTFGELDNALNIHTGGFYTYLSSYLENNSDDQLLSKFVVTAKATEDKTGQLFDIASEILNHSKLEDVERLKEVITRHQSQVESEVKNNGIKYAMTRTTSYYTNRGMFNELTDGLSYYNFITDLTDNFDKNGAEIVEKLQQTASLLFNKQNLIAGITCSEENYVIYQQELKKFIGTLPNEKVQSNTWAFDFEVKNEGLTSSSMVQYVVKGYDYKKLGYEWDGKMQVLNQILSRDYLQNKIRVMGGAYGGWAQISSTGNALFASYRDPNLSETLENFDAAPEFLKAFDVDSTEMTRFIIGTISNMDRPTTASQRGSMAINNCFTKQTKAKLEAERHAVLTTSVEDIRSYEEMMADVLAQDVICVYGNDQKIKDNENLFMEIKSVTN